MFGTQWFKTIYLTNQTQELQLSTDLEVQLSSVLLDKVLGEGLQPAGLAPGHGGLEERLLGAGHRVM